MRRLIAILLCLCQPSWAAVAFNANSASESESGTVSSPTTTTTMTVGSGSNRALLCSVFFDKAFATPGTVTVNWDSTGTNQSMTFIGSKDNSTPTVSASFWGLIAPTSGNHTFRVAWTVGTADVVSWCTDFTGVDQTSVAVAFKNFVSAAATSTNPNITITSAVGDLTVDGANLSVGSAPSSPTKTLIFNGATAGAEDPAGSRAAGASPNNVHSWTSGNVAWCEIGVDVAASGTTSGFSKRNKLNKLEAL